MNIDPKTTTISLAAVATIVVAIWVAGTNWSQLTGEVRRAHTRIDSTFMQIAQVRTVDTGLSEDISGVDDSLEGTERAVLLLKEQIRGLGVSVQDLSDKIEEDNAAEARRGDEVIRLLQQMNLNDVQPAQR